MVKNWTTSKIYNNIQKIHENIHGPRTKDTKFIEKVAEMNRMKGGLSDLKKLVNNFVGSFEGKLV